MEQTNQHVITLELLECPAFCVKDGLIRQVNSLAHRRMIQPGTPISDLLGINMAEYSEFNGGCLYLTIFLSGMACGASVLRTEDGDVFLLDSSSDELQALALAAQELRLPHISSGRIEQRIHRQRRRKRGRQVFPLPEPAHAYRQ